MSWHRRLRRRARALLDPASLDREVETEMRQHIDLEAAEIARTTGIPMDEAYRRARVAFGGVTRFREEHQDVRGVRGLEHLLRDLRHAGRALRRTPAFTLSAVLVLALGIGSTTAVYSAVNAVLNNPLHERLAIIYYRGFPSLSTVDFRAIEQQHRSFAAIGASRGGEAAVRVGSAEPERARIGRVTSGWFDALSLRAARGRVIASGDEPVGSPLVAVLSHGYAARAFRDADPLGQTILVDGHAHTVVGVLPETSEPFATRADVWSALQLAEPNRRGPFGMLVIARLRPDITHDAATRDVTSISDRIMPLWPFPDRSARFEARPVRTTLLAGSSRMLAIFSAAVALVLFIGVANVASLMLVRSIGRGREVSLRAVLGATRWQLARLFAAESALLAIVGALAGIATGALALRALLAIGPRMPGLSTAALDGRAILFAIAVALAAGLVVGAYPIVALLRGGVGAGSGGDRTIGDGRGTRALRSGFVVAQFALALPLLAIAGLLLTSFVRLQRVNPGFDPANLVTVDVGLPTAQYPNDTVVGTYWTRALQRVREIPGVREAGIASSMPPDDFGWSNDNFNFVDRPVPPGVGEPNAPWPFASPGYFAALGVRLLEGRMFTAGDTSPGRVVLVSRTWVRKHHPDGSPIGKTMIRGGCTECVPSTIVGVVDDVRYSGLTGPLESMYSPAAENPPRSMFLFARTARAPAEMVAPIREALRSVDPGVPLADIATMDERLYRASAQPRDWALLLGGFAIAALALATVGIFGMLSYLVTTRRREIGVRMALGAGRPSVVRLIVRNGMMHAAIGSVVGLVAALFVTRSLATMLYDVSASDPATLALVTAVLLGAALLASWLPARRAATIDPLEAIRAE